MTAIGWPADADSGFGNVRTEAERHGGPLAVTVSNPANSEISVLQRLSILFNLLAHSGNLVMHAVRG